MTSWPPSRHEEIQGRVRGLLIAVAPQLPAVTAGIVDEMIDANECGVALEIMSEMLVESGAAISAETLSNVSSLVDEMGLDQVNVDRLRSRVET
jgi:hypothetical protein